MREKAELKKVVFDFEKDAKELIGVVESVDTGNLIIRVENNEKLKRMQVNHLLVKT